MRAKRKIILLLAGLAHLFIAYAQKADSARFYYLRASDERAGKLFLPALQDFKLALKADPKNTDALRGAGLTAYDLNRFTESAPYFEQLNAALPKDTTAISKLATIWFNLRQWDKSRTFGQKALAAHTGSRVNYMLGKAYYEQEDYAHAFNYLPVAAREEPKNAEIPYMMARSYVDMNNFKPAISYYQQAIALDSSQKEWIYECALVYANMNDDASAIRYYDIAAAKGIKKTTTFMKISRSLISTRTSLQKGSNCWRIC